MFIINRHKQPTDSERKKGAIISIIGYCKNSHKKQKFSVLDIKNVYFEFGEEKDAIKTFVDTNYDVLKSLNAAHFSGNFSPPYLFGAYIQYMKESVLPDKIPEAPQPSLIFGKDSKREKYYPFCTYVRRRAKPLLKDSQSLLHNCPFLNDFFEGGEETERIFNSLKQQNMSRFKELNEKI